MTSATNTNHYAEPTTGAVTPSEGIDPGTGTPSSSAPTGPTVLLVGRLTSVVDDAKTTSEWPTCGYSRPPTPLKYAPRSPPPSTSTM